MPIKKPLPKKQKWFVHCPKCKSTFDVSEQMQMWKQEFIKVLEGAVIKFKEKSK